MIAKVCCNEFSKLSFGQELKSPYPNKTFFLLSNIFRKNEEN